MGNPKEKPAIKTGMCIGRNVVPGPKTWNAIGKISPMAINNPAKVICFIVLLCIVALSCPLFFICRMSDIYFQAIF